MAPIQMTLSLCLLLLSATSSLSTPAPESGGETTSSIYDALSSHGLPIGLLPKGVKSFEIDENGGFQAHLEEACDAKFESELHYDRNVSGSLSYGQIGNLTGVAAQELFLWFPVKGIRVDLPSSGLIYFDVGVVSKQFSLSLFESPPDCVVGPPPPPDFHAGESIIRNPAKQMQSHDSVLIRENLEKNGDEMRNTDDRKGPRLINLV